MNIHDLHEKLSEKFPRSLSCPWDNDGIMISADPTAQAKRILIALDASSEVLRLAADNGFDTVVTHHPMIFKGLRSVTPHSLGGSRVLSCALGGISVISLHTRMDAGDDGVNDSLVRALGFEPTGVFGDDEAPALGRTADIPPMSGGELALLVKEKLGCDSVRVTGDIKKIITRAAFCGGDGKDFVYPALYAGCGAYITGDSGYNMAEDAADEGLVVIEAGHYHSEAPVLPVLARIIEEITSVKPELCNSCAYRII